MTDLRKAIIKLAYDNPEIREDLVPLRSDLPAQVHSHHVPDRKH